MKIRKPLRFILLGACLIHSLAIATDTEPANTNADKLPNTEISVASKDDLSAQKELFQLQLDAKKELLQKDIEAQSKRIDAFEKRIEDQTSRISDISASVDKFGIIAGILGILTTALLVLIGVVGYKAAKSDARETAKETSEQTAEKWFEAHHKNLLSRMEELENTVIKACERIDGHEEKVAQKSNAVHTKMEVFEKTLEDQMDSFQRQLSQSATIEKSENKSPKDNSAIEQKAEQLKQKPENEYTFIDWNTRAFAAYSEGKLEDAIFYWDKAIASSDIQPQAQAQAMLNKGVTLGELNRGEEAVAVYNALISRFSTTAELQKPVLMAMFNKGFRLSLMNRKEEAVAAYNAVISKFGTAEKVNLREIVANAMVNNGFTLGQLNRGEEEIVVYNAIIENFGSAQELSLREAVAKGMVNKGGALSQLGRYEEAIAAHDAVITKFDIAKELILRNSVADAWNGKGFSLLCMAKVNWENITLAKEHLVNASNACNLSILINSDNGAAYGNLAYITWLQGNADAATQHFSTGLSSRAFGGAELYKATLADFEIHPIEPDQGFRELVEKLWEEYKQSQ
jgi:tetratricopeptide (TPR) repeat protein